MLEGGVIVLKIQSDSRQVPKAKDICANKKYYDILYAYLQCISVRDEKSKIRYFSKKELNFSKLGEIFNLSRQTVSTKFKNLKELGLVVERDNETYKLVELSADLASLVPYKTLKLITDTLNENSISTYVYLLNCYYANGCQPFQFTLEQIKSYIGISTATRSNNDTVTNILYVLEKVGLIKYSLTTLKQEADTFQNVKTIYQLDWLTNTLN
jgi:Mn-dependent DtxR family transcriptional regulator